MSILNLLNSLNDKQYNAVTTSSNNLLVLAGAGSGKTRVLVYRIAWLISVKNCSPSSIIAVTFTNKAASEMRSRINEIIGIDQSQGIWIGTFHGLAHRLLRLHYVDIGLPKEFQIIDSDDQLKLIKRIIKLMNLDDKRYAATKCMWYINDKKDKGMYPNNINIYNNPFDNIWHNVYKTYQETCNRSGLLDFAEILLRARELWLTKPMILNHYKKTLNNILVDEFQDINQIQYEWIRLLTGNKSTITIVGDDDQSIYGWRGAQVGNIKRFLNDFPNSNIVRLEQNYRCTNNILKAANSLISHNNIRLGKTLWTNGKDGQPISLYCAADDIDEVLFVVNSIREWQKKGNNLSDCAVLYRSNAQSRLLEEKLLKFNINYRIYGGTRFFDRQEIKNSIAYMRLIVNRNDDSSFERIVNIPIRGIGERTLSLIRNFAKEKKITMWHAANNLLNSNVLVGRSANAIKSFCKLINSIEIKISDLDLYKQAQIIIQDTGILSMYKNEKGEKGYARIDNLNELITAIRQFDYHSYDSNLNPLQSFLSYVSLEYTEHHLSEIQDTVQLMTLHAAKGLEFIQVFIIGLEENIFPNKRCLDTIECLEEERRLAYVGITRAITKLVLTYAQNRRLYNKDISNSPSRFIYELPAKCIIKIHSRFFVKHKTLEFMNQKINKNICNMKTNFFIGQKVKHPTFGKGVILNIEGDGNYEKVKVLFQQVNIKWLVSRYANLEIFQ